MTELILVFLVYECVLNSDFCRNYKLIVNASRIPPRPLAGQRLRAAKQQLEAWKGAPDSS